MNDIKIAADFAFRILVLLFIVTFGVLFLIAGARSALAASLKPVAVLTDTKLTVGDLFQGLPDAKAEYVLGPAPQPGHDMVLNARTLMRIAAVVDLPWQPRHSAEQIVVRRAATVIDTDTIADAVSGKIREAGVRENFKLSYDTGTPKIILPHDMAPDMEFTKFEYSPRYNRFDATIVAPSKDNIQQEIVVSGTIDRMIKVPVLKSALRNGDIIGEGDIDYIEISSKEIQHDYVLDGEKLVGLTPRRMAMPSEPLRTVDLQQPQIVGRGEMITIIYDHGPMFLTAKGKALQNGAKGDIVNVVNATSSRTVQGIISGERQVTVQ